MENQNLIVEKKPTEASKGSFFKPVIQKKLSIGSPNDSYEAEADHVADKVMRMKEPTQQNVTQTGSLIQKKCTHCQEEELRKKPLAESITPLIQRRSTESGGESHAPSHVESQINSSRGGGSSMDHGTQHFMESRFGTDFSGVRIHTGSQAVQMSKELNAQAFTVGNDVYFNEGKYSPNSDSGRHLLAHELTHTVQQNGGIGRKIQKVCGRTSSAVSDFPNTYIRHIDVNISNPCSVTLTWIGSGASSQSAGPFHGTIGNGNRGRNNCNDTTVSNTSGTNCTPKGNFTIERQACHLGGYDEAKNASYFQESRGIAFHYWASRPDCPASHGCVRMNSDDSALIYDNVISERTADTHGHPATTVTVDGTWETCADYNKRIEKD
jgi:Domain of unknown function (DUF4157)/L,D-transpeptidase catalytic domain